MVEANKSQGFLIRKETFIVKNKGKITDIYDIEKKVSR